MDRSLVRLGVDLGGTKTEIVALDADGVERFRKRAATPRGDYEGTLALVAALVDEAERALGLRDAPVGIGTPGAPSKATGLMRNCNSTWLNGSRAMSRSRTTPTASRCRRRSTAPHAARRSRSA